MKDTAIKVDHVSKIYKLYDKPSDRLRESLGLTRKRLSKDHRALDDLSFEVARGETVGIIGTNGAGKSTILKIITGVLTPTEGQVDIDGRISALLELGAGFNMEYTGIENIYLNGTMIGFSNEEIEARMEDILRFADIGEFVHQPVKTYSSGMFVRLAFAVAINIDPEILIVDEALSVGDVFFQNKCYKKFSEFKEKGKTILFVSHDLSSISKYCDRVVLLDHGHMLAEGEPKEMIDLYKKVLADQAAEKTGASLHIAEKTDAEDAGAVTGGKGTASQGTDVAGPTGKLAQANSSEGESAESGSKISSVSGLDSPHAGADASGVAAINKAPLWKDAIVINPDLQEYGEMTARIADFGIFDASGTPTNVLEKGKPFSIKMRIESTADIDDPIFAMTIKNLQGTDVTGTNTFLEGVDLTALHDGDVKVATFTQQLDLQGGEYLISFGCTGYIQGELHVFHRLYDACNITVVSDKNTVGYYDMNSVVTVE